MGAIFSIFEFDSAHRANSKANLKDAMIQYRKRYGKRYFRITRTCIKDWL